MRVCVDTKDEEEKFVKDAQALTDDIIATNGSMGHVAHLLNIYGVFTPSEIVRPSLSLPLSATPCVPSTRSRRLPPPSSFPRITHTSKHKLGPPPPNPFSSFHSLPSSLYSSSSSLESRIKASKVKAWDDSWLKQSGIGDHDTPRNGSAFGLYRNGPELRGVYIDKPKVAKAACDYWRERGRKGRRGGCDQAVLLGKSWSAAQERIQGYKDVHCVRWGPMLIWMLDR